LGRLAVATAIVSAVGSPTILAGAVTTSTSGYSSTPNDIEVIVVDGDLNVLRLTSIDSEVAISWSRVHEEALAYVASLDALCALEAVAISTASGVSGRIPATA
jgi:hypothetical protein